MKAKNLSLKFLLSNFDIERPVSWAKVFGREAPLSLEIGFGDGDFLESTAKEFSDHNFLGVEKIWERLCKTLRKVNREDITSVRLMLIDVTVLLERYIKPKVLSNVYCLFPCPWPKKAHIKHRLFSRSFLRLLNSRMVDGGYFKVVTDHEPYFEWILAESKGCGFNVQKTLIEPSYNTKFERKWSGEGQEKFFKLEFTKKEHVNLPLIKDAELKPLYIDDFNPDRFFPEDVSGQPAVVFKDYVYDERRNKAMIRCVVSEDSLTQHMWIMVRKNERGWCIVPAEGHRFIPTEAVSQALKIIKRACSSTAAVNSK